MVQVWINRRSSFLGDTYYSALYSWILHLADDGIGDIDDIYGSYRESDVLLSPYATC